MKHNAAKTDYRDRIDRVLIHIRDHLDDELDLDELAEIACLSRFHWHRVYRELIGETVWQTVHRLRLSRASLHLIESDAPISEIAVRAGYSGRQAFARAFGESYGASPLQYRAQGGHRICENFKHESGGNMYEVRIEVRQPVRIAGFVHTGSYREINVTFGKLTAELSTNGPVDHVAMAAVYHDDPDLVADAQLQSLAGVVLSDGVPIPTAMTHVDLPGGRYAILVHKGPYSELQNAYSFLFGSWLKESGETLRPVPAAEIYLNSPVTVAPKDLVTEILLAIE